VYKSFLLILSSLKNGVSRIPEIANSAHLGALQLILMVMFTLQILEMIEYKNLILMVYLSNPGERLVLVMVNLFSLMALL
jgi:hypothetical protein